ncbi:hypothetical protein FRAAL6815 [Frankia alni ACN14a]|uniref:Uncharacterized protein n=1 Tax=Frankia alni (strain DSM 45986 / CECT 9034 / ACN14a) TaxID=326424 RepID=Q0RAV2_FRAAA|nr:hypothetical protein FRAAL6815 [Frankia alni ACN14a]
MYRHAQLLPLPRGKALRAAGPASPGFARRLFVIRKISDPSDEVQPGKKFKGFDNVNPRCTGRW